MSTRILLTGSAGFTGLHFARLAEERGHEVVALQADLTDAAAVEEEVGTQAFDQVVHLAAIAAVTHADQAELYRVNLFGTLNLLAAVRAANPGVTKVLLASSANVYGNAEHSPIDEDSAPAPVNHYAMSKLAMEHMARAQFGDLPLVITRPFNYTGAGQDDRFLIPKLVRHFAERAEEVELGNTHVEREFNDVRTVCNAYLDLLGRGESGQTYNVCSGRPWSLEQVIASLSELAGYRIRTRVNPAFVRDNEVHRLCGNPARLEAAVGALRHPPLAYTLRWMLDSTTAGGA